MIITLRLYEDAPLSGDEKDNIERAITDALDASYGGRFEYDSEDDRCVTAM